MTYKMSRNTHSMTLTISAVLMSLGLGASQAMAQDAVVAPPQEPVAVAAEAVALPAPGSFEALDTNADAALAKEEIPAGDPLLKKFKKADTDKDGHLNKDEFNAYLAKR